MSDLQLLLLILVLVYGWECLHWFPRGAAVLVSRGRRRWRLRQPGRFAGNPSGGFVLAPPLPPLGHIVGLPPFPLSLDSQTVLAYVATLVHSSGRAPQSGACLDFAAAKAVKREGKRLVFPDQPPLKAASTVEARQLVALLRSLADLAPNQREAGIEKAFQGTLEVKAARKRWDEFRERANPLRRTANLLFVYLFLVCPLAVFLVGLAGCWWALAAGLLILDGAIAWFFHRAHAALYPAEEEERFSLTLTVFLSPCSAIRANDLLSRHLLTGFHPLAAIRLFCSPVEFRRVSARWLRDLLHPAQPVCPSSNPKALAAEAESRQRWQRLVEEFLVREGLEVRDLLAAPAAMDAECERYCPRCLAQFTRRADQCPDCGGVELLLLNPSRPSAPGMGTRPGRMRS